MRPTVLLLLFWLIGNMAFAQGSAPAAGTVAGAGQRKEEKLSLSSLPDTPRVTFRRNNEAIARRQGSVNELFASYTARLDPLLIRNPTNSDKQLKLGPLAVEVDPTGFASAALAHQFLLELRKQALAAETTPEKGRELLGPDSRWAGILFPHGSVWPWRWHWPSRKYRRLGFGRERKSSRAFERRLAQLLEANWLQQPVPAVGQPVGAPQVDFRLNPNDEVPVEMGGSQFALRRQYSPNDLTRVRIELRAGGAGMQLLAQQASYWSISNPPSAEAVADELWRLAAPTMQAAVPIQQSLAKLDKLRMSALADTLRRIVAQYPALRADSLLKLAGRALTAEAAEAASRDKAQKAKLHNATSAAFNAFNSFAKTYGGLSPKQVDRVRERLRSAAPAQGFAPVVADTLFTKVGFAARQPLSAAEQKAQRYAAYGAGAAVAANSPDSITDAGVFRKLPAYLSLKKAVDLLLAQPEPVRAKPAGEAPNLLYSSSLLLPTQPVRRLARLYVYDRGEGTSTRARYAVCLQYTATDPDFQDLPDAVAECAIPKGYVGISAELVTLDRAQLVEVLFGQLLAKMKSLGLRAGQVTDAARRASIEGQIIPHLEPDSAVVKKAAETAVGTVAGTKKGGEENTLVQTTEGLSLRESLRDFYDDLVRHQERLTDAPRAGTVLLGQVLTVYECEDMDDQRSVFTFAVDSVGMEVEDGSAMNIKAYGRINGIQVLFETFAPLNLSSDYDLQTQWYRQRMYLQGSRVANILGAGQPNGQSLCLHLHELLRYYPQLLARTSDRSPADGIYVFRPQDPITRRVLRKAPTSKLLQARIYTDAVGLTGDRPNGLIQLEIDKKFILLNRFYYNTPRAQIGLLNYIHPFVSLNKIEENNSRLLYRHETLVQQNQFSRERTVRTIDLLRYTSLRVGLAQNVGLLHLPSLKSVIALDYRVELSRVPVRDTLGPSFGAPPRANPRDSTLNVLTYGPRLMWRVRPDSRFGAQFSASLVMQNLFNTTTTDNVGNTVTQIKEDYGPGPGSHGSTVVGRWFRTTGQTLLQYEMLLWAYTSENSQLFFRTRFSNLRYAMYQTYFQCQIGYQFDVFTNRRTAVMPAGLFGK